MSLFGVVLVLIFRHSYWIPTRITPNTDTFHAVFFVDFNNYIPHRQCGTYIIIYPRRNCTLVGFWCWIFVSPICSWVSEICSSIAQQFCGLFGPCPSYSILFSLHKYLYHGSFKYSLLCSSQKVPTKFKMSKDIGVETMCMAGAKSFSPTLYDKIYPSHWLIRMQFWF